MWEMWTRVVLAKFVLTFEEPEPRLMLVGN